MFFVAAKYWRFASLIASVLSVLVKQRNLSISTTLLQDMATGAVDVARHPHRSGTLDALALGLLALAWILFAVSVRADIRANRWVLELTLVFASIFNLVIV